MNNNNKNVTLEMELVNYWIAITKINITLEMKIVNYMYMAPKCKKVANVKALYVEAKIIIEKRDGDFTYIHEYCMRGNKGLVGWYATTKHRYSKERKCVLKWENSSIGIE